MRPAHILIVEDEGLVAEEIALHIRRMGHVVTAVVDNALDAFQAIRTVRPDMVLLDINIKGAQNGIQIAHRFRTEFNVPVVFLTAHADPFTLQQATQEEPFGYLVKPFDQRTLAATLETALRRHEAEAKLAKMEHWLAATLSSIGDAVIATDRDFHVSFINPAAERLCGWPRGSALGRPVAEIFRLSGSSPSSTLEAIAEATSGSVVIALDECEIERPDKTLLSIDHTMAPIRDASGEIGGVVVAFRDAGMRKRYQQELLQLNSELEDRVRRRTAQLEAANREMASFAYSIAHDLRAPLRAIHGFATRVMDQHGIALGEEGRRLLEIVVSRAGQMSRMIDDYLKLSGLSHVALTHTNLDMTQLAQQAWVIAIDAKDQVPQLELAELPPAQGDENLIRQVWVNLLSNAVKFSRSAAQPKVRVSGTSDARTVSYRVEDNGVGFDPAHSSKLFRVFERPHKQEDFEGNGVGLCIVQRILHRHEGDITISGVLGQGACVQFWLPRAPVPDTVLDAP